MYRAAILFGLMVLANVAADELPKLEAYGALPESSLVTLSPDGSKVAQRFTTSEVDAISIVDLDTGDFVAGARADEVNPKQLTFANEDILLLVTRGTYDDARVHHAFDYSSAHSFNLKTKEVRTLLRNIPSLYEYQAGLGRIVGKTPEGNTLFMPAYYDTGGKPILSLYAVRLDRIGERRVKRGNRHTIDWFVDQDGKPLIREEFDDDKNVHRIWHKQQGRKPYKLLYEKETALVLIRPVGISQDGQSLVFFSSPQETGFRSYFLMNLEDGSISGPILERQDADIDGVFTTANRVVLGVAYSGFFPSYYFFNEELNERVENIQKRFPGISAELVAWSDDFKKLIFLVSGGWSSGTYLLFDGDNPRPVSIGLQRPEIKAPHIAPTIVDSYAARDGLQIPALITAREDVYEQGNAPLIVLPHGGPSAQDYFGFDWQAQYFASRGYVVLQPQYRGSSGFGIDFASAGLGEWGGKMQTDLDDGVEYLADAGIIDRSRVCVFGSSYGGYAALAAGAFSPDLYRCVVSVSGVSDLYAMLKTERSQNGKNNWVLSYWSKQFGAGLAGREFLNSISPAHHAHKFNVPVLLVHGKEDTVVSINQSKKMHEELRKAGKDVTFVQLDGEDHGMTQAGTRLQMLEAVADFIDEHL